MEKVRALALDLNRSAPRSPRAALGNFPAVAARLLDKCRAELVGWSGSYHYNCPMDRKFLGQAKDGPLPLELRLRPKLFRERDLAARDALPQRASWEYMDYGPIETPLP